MGPERVFPPCEDDDKSPRDGDAVGGAAWSGGEEDQEGEGPTPQEDGGGYSYQPLSQDGDDSGDGNLQHRMEVMGLHLPEAPSPDSDDEDPEGAAAERSRASIPMDAGQDRTGQDNAAVHNVRLPEEYVTLLERPLSFAERNPIENIWGWMAEEVYKSGHHFQTADALGEAFTCSLLETLQQMLLKSEES
ncbi:male-enhanced antigen 1 isoform X1 [Phycodurus eques]|uniref:male-enhanced antigen 1 isoform X1 n=1 Tax=Phycodurus eques TaxID=693459 RepID=UPI002ACE211C|nr:male-enhanced antigen 1 isoform X1 [Phycodurus eques]XP_061545754.1 male-enhanced antigen 1 isoform X1 [Phycodurus eques]